MSWLNRIFKRSRHKTSWGDYHANADGMSNRPSVPPSSQQDYVDEDFDRAIALSLSEEEKKVKAVDDTPDLEDDEQLARAMQESLNVESPPRRNGEIHVPVQLPPVPDYRICAGCNIEINHGRYVNNMGSFWHPVCFVCHGCNEPISEPEFSMQEEAPYHISCFKELYHPKCDVCKEFIPTNHRNQIEYRTHPFWCQKYCPTHEYDGTPRCCSCERIQPRDTTYITLDDGRELCLECLHFAIMDNTECQPLYIDIHEFYEGLNMKVQQQIPLLLVERQALNEAMQGEQNGHRHLPETRGLCLSEEQIVRTVLRRPSSVGPGSRMIGMLTEPCRLVRRCEVTAILVLFGLPRLLTGNILAHEIMHAWLRLNGFPTLRPEVEEGICQVLAYLWLDSEIVSGTGGNLEPSSSSSSSFASSKKGPTTEDEKKLGEFFKYQIFSDTSSVYGDGFRAAYKSVVQHSLRRTLDHIKLTGNFP